MTSTIGDNIAQLRRTMPMTQEALAEAAGVSVEIIRKLEQNERTSARIKTVHKLAQALGVPTSALLGDATQATTRREPDEDDLGLFDVRRILTPARGLSGFVVDAAAVRAGFGRPVEHVTETGDE